MIKSKCKLCDEIVEKKMNEIVSCRCGEISLDGVTKTVKCKTSRENYVEVDGDGFEIISEMSVDKRKTRLEELLSMLDEMERDISRLPSDGMLQPINHYDMSSLILLLSTILKNMKRE